MSAKTKIVVLHMKEVIYTGIFAALGILLIVLLVMMFLPDKEEGADRPGTAEDGSMGTGGTDADSGSTGSGNSAGSNGSAGSGTGNSNTDGTGNVAAGGRNDADSNGAGTGTADGDAAATLSGNLYIPGIYTTQLVLNDQAIDVEVTVDSEAITSIRLVNLTDAIATMYPLLSPTFEALRDQICEKQSVENITYDTESKYTSLVLLEAIRNSLSKAYAATGESQGGE